MNKFKVGDIVNVEYDARYCTSETLGIFPTTLQRSTDQKVFGVITKGGITYYEIDYPDYPGENYIVVEEKYLTPTVKSSTGDVTISYQDAVSIIDMACPSWKKKLAEKWGADIILKNNIAVTKEFIKEMFEASSSEQKYVLLQIFPNNKEEETLDSIRGEIDHFSEHSTLRKPMIEIRNSSNLAYKGYWLNPVFDWEIIKDDSGASVLVPKRK